MPRPPDPLAAERVAAAVAPIIDRLRLSIVRRAAVSAQELAERLGVSQPATMTLGMLRNLMPDRVVRRSDVFEVFLYADPSGVDGALAALVNAGLLDQPDDAQLQLTELGRSAVNEIYRVTTRIVEDLWADHAPVVENLVDLVGRVVERAAKTGGPAFAVMAPAPEPPNAPASVLLAERLTPLRFHRYDAHAAAWRAAGLTVEEVKALAAGPARDAIEAETNRRAAPPYAALTPPERFALVAGLGALPN